MKKVYLSSKREGNTLPLSGAYEVGGLVFVSGQIHITEDRVLLGDTIEEKLDATFANVKKVLKEVGLGLDDIIHVRLFVTDLSTMPALNAAYVTYFSGALPARIAVEVPKLSAGAEIEMEVIAARE